MLGTGVENGVKLVMWFETPTQTVWNHTKHHRRQVGPPHAPRAVIGLAAHDRVAEYPLRGIIVHRHFRALGKDRESLPVVMQTAQDLSRGEMEVGLLKILLKTSWQLVQLT